MSLVLYGSEMWNSPYVLSCFVALREKRLPFQMRVIALHRGAQHEPAYVGTSLTSRVPALVDGALSLSESSAIVEYLDDKFHAPEHPLALPADLAQRARAPGDGVGAQRRGRAARRALVRVRLLLAERRASPRPLVQAGERAATKVVRIARALVPERGGPLFGSWCVADTDLAMMLWRLSKTGYALPETLRAFAEAEWQRESVREFVAMERPGFVAYL